MAKSEFLIRKHTPNIYNFLRKRNYKKWNALDTLIEKQLKVSGTTKTNFITLLFKIEMSNNPFLKSFATYIDTLVQEIIDRVPNKEKRLWDSFNGKFDNIEDWNYLNPIGEFSVLKKLIDSNLYDLIEIEAQFPNNKPKDFLVKQRSNNKNKYIEVVNIHIPIGMNNFKEIKRHLISKVSDKIKRETKSITKKRYLEDLIIIPVVWYLETVMLKDDYQFFKSFNETLGKSFGINKNTLGFCTYVKTSENEFIFGEASSIMENYIK